MRLPSTAHTSRPWRIHELTHDFRLEDVWALATPGGPDDFGGLVAGIASGDLSQGSSRAASTLWAIRWKIGEMLGWDGPDAGVGSRVQTLRDRLPADLREGPSGPDFAALPFSSLYLLKDEFAAEIANRTMHGVGQHQRGPGLGTAEDLSGYGTQLSWRSTTCEGFCSSVTSRNRRAGAAAVSPVPIASGLRGPIACAIPAPSGFVVSTASGSRLP